MLDEAEGLREDQLPAYNAVLWLWRLSSALSLLAANPPGARRFAIAGLLHFPILLASASITSAGPVSRPARARALEPRPAGAVGKSTSGPVGARGAVWLTLRQSRRGG